MDTEGNWYLDMDSNYSATNLGTDAEEIAYLHTEVVYREKSFNKNKNLL